MSHFRKTVRWGIIGCGSVTEVKSGPAFQQVPGFELRSVMRRTVSLAQDYAKRHGVPNWTSDPEQIISDPQIDAVYIATPPDTHHSYALQVAAAGKICCVEKPMALNHLECVEMVEAFERAQRPLFVSYYRRSLPRFTTIKSWLDEQRIGQVRHVDWKFCRQPTTPDLDGAPNWRTDPTVSGGGYFSDLASHGLDLLLYWLGDIDAVAGFARNQQGLYRAADAVTACWAFQSGATGSGFWNFCCNERLDRLTIHGSAGKISCSVFEESAITLFSEGRETILDIAHPQHIQLPHVQNMRLHLDGKIKHPSLGRDAMKATEVMDAIMRHHGEPRNIMA